MTVAHVYRITFKQRNCMVTIKQNKITYTMKKRTNNEVTLVKIVLNSWQFIIVTMCSVPDGLSFTVYI